MENKTNHTLNELAPWAVYAQTEWHVDEQAQGMRWINPTVYNYTMVPATYERVSPRFNTEAQAIAYLPNIR